MDRSTLSQLKRYAVAFKEARDRGANESDTVMFLVKFFEEVLGWNSFKGEISKEAAVKDRFCDIALKIDGQTKLLIECKAAGISNLVDKNIEQAENYASRAGVRWVMLTNGIDWQLYHLTFAEGEGIQHDLAFRANLIDDLDANADALWEKLGLVGRKSMDKGEVDKYWEHQKSLCKGAIVRALFTQDVLMVIRRELNRDSTARVELEDVFAAVRESLSKEALLEAGDIGMKKRRKKRRKITQADASGKMVTQEVDDDSDEADIPSPASAGDPAPPPPIHS